jgi:hypothetical protein
LLILAALLPGQFAYAADVGLEGCWTSLHVEERMVDGHINHIHNNCVMAFTRNQAQTDCQFPKGGHYTALSKMKFDREGQITLSLVSANSIAKQTLKPETIDYLIEGDYLVLRQSLGSAPDAPPATTALEITRTLLRVQPLAPPHGKNSSVACVAGNPAP